MRPAKTADPAWIKFADRCYAAALFLFSTTHRNEYGPWMRQAFRDRCREVARGEHSAFRVLALELAPDLITSLGREHMQASFGTMRPRQMALLGTLCAALIGVLFKDAITPPVLDAVVTVRNRVDNYLDLRETQATEAQIQRIAEHLAGKGDAHSKALAALLYRSIAQRKQSFYRAPDWQNEAFYHRPPEDASFENQRVAALVNQVLTGQADEYALTMAAHACDADSGCDADRVVARLTAIAPDNRHVWGVASAEAAKIKDRAAMRYAIRRLAQAREYKTYEGRAANDLLTAGREIEQGNHAWVIAQARAITGGLFAGSAAARHCLKRHSELATTERNFMLATPEECYRVYQLLAGSTQLGLSVAGWTGIAHLADDQESRRQAHQHLRDLYWLAGARFEHPWTVRFRNGRFDSESAQESFIDALAESAGEIPSLQRWFAAQGRSAHAPVDYYVPAERLPDGRSN